MIIIFNSFGLLMSTELIRLKRTSAFWLTLAGAALLPVAYFIGYLNYIESALSAKENPWIPFFNQEWKMLSFLLLPLYIVLVTGFLMQIEHKAKGWKQLLTLPLNKSAIYVSKLFIIVLTVITCYILFILFSLLAGTALNLIYPGLTFLSYRPAFALILLITLKSFISTLGLIAFQYWLSLRFKNFIIPIGIGIAGTILSGIIIHHWKHEAFFLYLQPALSLLDRPKTISDFTLAKSECISITYFLAFVLIGYLDFSYKNRY